MKLKFTFLFLMSLFISSFVLADEIGIELARKVAKNCFYEQTGIKQSNIIFSEEIAHENGQAVYFVFNYKDGGFVIVAADDDVRPIIGYSKNSIFETENQPLHLQSWLSQYSQEILYVRENRINASKSAQNEWDKYTSDFSSFEANSQTKGVEPLTEEIKWNQDAGWNAACPEDEDGPGGHVYAGCVATAMSIIMKYWSYPLRGTGSHSYYANEYDYTTGEWYNYGTLTADFGNTTYFYSYMDNEMPNEYSALLMYHCAVAVEMGFTPGGSGAFSTDVPSVLYSYFGFEYPTYRDRNNFSASTWQGFLKDDLDAGQPIYYSGRDADNGGHAFVCDGYDETVADDYFSFNFGWGGSSNGFYYANSSSSFEFYYQQASITGIIPSEIYPDAPQSFSAVHDTINLDNFKIDLSWEAPESSDGLTGYKIYRGDEEIDEVGNDILTYTESFEAGFEDYYGVCAVYDTEQSNFSSSFIDGLFNITFKVLIPGTTTGIHMALVNFNETDVNAGFGLANFPNVPFGHDYEYEITHNDYATTSGIIEVVYKDTTYVVEMDGGVSIENISVNRDISIYPNPSNGIFNINSSIEIDELKVFNIAGQLIQDITNPTTIDLTNYSEGVYLIKIKTKENIYYDKIIKE